MRNEWQPLLAACALILCAALGFGLLMSPTSPWLSYEAAIYNKGRIDHRGNEQSSQHGGRYIPTVPEDQFFGLLRANPDECYQGENQGQCAARIVQDRVAGAYIWLILVAGAQALIGVCTFWAIDRQRRIMSQQTAIARQQADISKCPSGNKQSPLNRLADCP